jgi:hypothetical protein
VSNWTTETINFRAGDLQALGYIKDESAWIDFSEYIQEMSMNYFLDSEATEEN